MEAQGPLLWIHGTKVVPLVFVLRSYACLIPRLTVGRRQRVSLVCHLDGFIGVAYTVSQGALLTYEDIRRPAKKAWN